MADLSGPDADIPDEAIEAAALAVYAHDGYTNDLAEIRKKPEYDGWADDYFESARAALAAAMPSIRRHIMAQGWREGFDAGENMAHMWGHVDHWEDYPDNPYVARGGSDADL